MRRISDCGGSIAACSPPALTTFDVPLEEGVLDQEGVVVEGWSRCGTRSEASFELRRGGYLQDDDLLPRIQRKVLASGAVINSDVSDVRILDYGLRERQSFKPLSVAGMCHGYMLIVSRIYSAQDPDDIGS